MLSFDSADQRSGTPELLRPRNPRELLAGELAHLVRLFTAESCRIALVWVHYLAGHWGLSDMH
jgi:hypothetical protein